MIKITEASTLLLSLTVIAGGQVTIYKQNSLGPTSTATNGAAQYTGAAAYDPTILDPPPIPDPPPPMAFTIALADTSPPGLSISQTGPFLGFSIEMSVSNQILGKNSSFIAVPFLNLIANIQQRAGEVRIRVGGNTQETAKLVDALPDGKMLQKDVAESSNPTQTPPLDYTRDLFVLMNAISDLVNVRWFLGIPFFNTDPFDLSIAEASQSILGDRLIGLQVGNEPDLYAHHGHRPPEYSPQDYVSEFGRLVEAMGNDANEMNRNILVGPSLANNPWNPQQIWDTGFVDSYSDNLAFLAFEKYPTDNCYSQFGVGTYHDPQVIFANYLTHAAGQHLAAQYLESTAYAQGKGKQVLMFETNTASCGGFPGISDSFGAALWGLDYGMQLAYSNFSGALMHIGGQNVYYNPFTPPPTNQSTFRQWTIGPIYYSALIMAEIFGSSSVSQIIDLEANEANVYTPAYAVYENGSPVRVALFNYITDPTGANTYSASISIGDLVAGTTMSLPPTVRVKYLTADSVSQKGNFRWAGQTFGDHFESDGRLVGNEDVQTVTCDQVNGVCSITVPAPGFALVFLTDDALTEEDGAKYTTFATTAMTKTINTATVDPAVLATSNGHGAWDPDRLSSTSKGSQNGAIAVELAVGIVTLILSVCGLLVMQML